MPDKPKGPPIEPTDSAEGEIEVVEGSLASAFRREMASEDPAAPPAPAEGATPTPAPLKELKNATIAAEGFAARALEGAAQAAEGGAKTERLARKAAEDAQKAEDDAARAAAAAEKAEAAAGRAEAPVPPERAELVEKAGRLLSGESSSTGPAPADEPVEAPVEEPQRDADQYKPFRAPARHRASPDPGSSHKFVLGGNITRSIPKKPSGGKKGLTARVLKWGGILGVTVGTPLGVIYWAMNSESNNGSSPTGYTSTPPSSYTKPTPTTTTPTGPTTATTPPTTATVEQPTTPTTTPTGPTTTATPTTPTTQTPTIPTAPTTTEPTTPTGPTTTEPTTPQNPTVPTTPKEVEKIYETDLPQFEPDNLTVRKLASGYMRAFIAYLKQTGQNIEDTPETRNLQYHAIAGDGVLQLSELESAMQEHEVEVAKLEKELGRELKDLRIVTKPEDPSKVRISIKMPEDQANRLTEIVNKYNPNGPFAVALFRMYSKDGRMTKDSVDALETALQRFYGDKK